MKPERRSSILEMTMRGMKTRQRRRRKDPCDSMMPSKGEEIKNLNGL